MTVNTELSRAEFAWTGVESAFAAGFPADKAGDVRVLYRTPAGVISTLVNGVNYSVTLATGSKLVTIVPLSLPAAPGTVVVRRSTPALVTDTLQDGEGFSLEIIQRLHDIAAMRSAEDRDTLARAITLEEGAALGEGDFDLGGSGLANVAPGSSPTHAATVAQLQAILVGAGNVPAPVLEQIGKYLRATGVDTFEWDDTPAVDLSGFSINALGDVDTATSPPVLGLGIIWNGTQFVPGASVAGRFKGNGGTIGTRPGDILRINAQTLTEDVTVEAAENAQATGPLAVASGKTLTVDAGATLVIL